MKQFKLILIFILISSGISIGAPKSCFVKVDDYQPPSLKQYWVDLKKGGKWPAGEVQFETYASETCANGFIFIGTNPNGHLLKLNISDSSTTDLGRVASPDENFPFETDLVAITHDTQYVYGGTSMHSGLFYMPLTGTAPTYFKPSALDKVTQMWSPQIYENNLYKYLFFACNLNTNELGIVRWRIPKNTNGDPVPGTDNEVTLITLLGGASSPTQFTVSNQLSLDQNSNPVLVLGTNSNQIIIYNINSEARNIISPTYNSNPIKTWKIVANPAYPEQCWIFDSASCYLYDYSTQTASNPITIKPTDDAYSHYLYYNNCIYTDSQKLDLSTNILSNYVGEGHIRGREILISGDTLWGVSMWGGKNAKPYIDYASLNNLTTYSKYINFPSNQTDKVYGGNEIVGLTAYNKEVFGSSAITTDFIYDPNNPDWIYNNLPSGLAQADELFPYNNALFGGYYNKPELVVSSLNNDRTPNPQYDIVSYLASINQSIGNQHRIRSFAGYTYGGNHYIFFSTCAYEDDRTGPSFLFKYVMETGNIYLIGKINSPVIDNLAVAPSGGDTVHIYGVASSVFVKNYKITSNEIDSSYIIPIKRNYGAAVMYHSPNLYIMCSDNKTVDTRTYIRKYSVLPNDTTGFLSHFEDLQISGNFCDGGKIVFGNDGNIYALWRSSANYTHENCVIKIDPNNLSSSIIIGSDTAAIQDDDHIVLQIDIDRGDTTNLDLYLGGYRGILKAYKSSYTPLKRNPSHIVKNQYYLTNNYPNPFNPSTNINFSLPQASFTQLKVYDVLGREIRTIVNEFLQKGNHKYKFDGTNLGSGIYFYTLKAGNYLATKKMILLK